MSHPFYSFGAFPDPPDPRDIPLLAVEGGFEETIALPAEFLPAKKPFRASQGVLGSCTGQSGANLMEIFQHKEHEEWIDLSARYVYAHNKSIDGFPGEGSYSRNTCKTLVKQGACLEEDFPEVNDKGHSYYINLSLRSPSADSNAAFHKAGGYAEISGSNWDGIKQGIFNHGAVILTVPVSWPEWSVPELSYNYKNHTAFHATVVDGWRKDGSLRQENSWGTSWADEGYAWFPPGYPVSNAWVLTDIPDDWNKPMIKLVIKGGEQYIRGRDGKDIHIYNVATLKGLHDAGIITSLTPEPVDIINDSGAELVALTKE